MKKQKKPQNKTKRKQQKKEKMTQKNSREKLHCSSERLGDPDTTPERQHIKGAGAFSYLKPQLTRPKLFTLKSLQRQSAMTWEPPREVG